MYQPNQFPKVCACKKVYTEEEWKTLPYQDVQLGTIEERRYYADCEMRGCSCESTMSVKLKEAQNEVV